MIEFYCHCIIGIPKAAVKCPSVLNTLNNVWLFFTVNGICMLKYTLMWLLSFSAFIGSCKPGIQLKKKTYLSYCTSCRSMQMLACVQQAVPHGWPSGYILLSDFAVPISLISLPPKNIV